MVERRQVTDIKVASWNIEGPGRAGPHNDLVPLVVDDIKPDVLLLQDATTDKLIKLIKEQCQDRSYVCEVAGDKKQARILYDSKRWILSGSQSAKSNLLDCIAEFPREYRIKKRNGDVYFISSQDFFDDWVAAVRLRHKDIYRRGDCFHVIPQQTLGCPCASNCHRFLYNCIQEC